MSVRVSLTGRLEVETDRRTLDATHLPGRQGRVVLAYLIAEHDRLVPSEELAEAVWGPQPPPTWRPALRGVISRVREFLEAVELPGDDMLTSSSGCYQLVLPRDATVDVELAAEEADAAERALAAGDLERAVAEAASARALAGRPLLPGQEGAWVERRRASWHELLVRSLQVLVDAGLAGGDADLAVQAATELVGLEPFRESAHLSLMQAHAAAGNPGEALRAYDRCRRLLAEELGVDPSPELEAFYLDLLRAAPANQEDLRASPGLRLPPAGEPPGESTPGEEAFVGRGAELARLRAAWEGARAGRRRLFLVTGEAGIGKSRLAGELAALAERDGATVLFGSCDKRLGVSFLPLRAALRPYLAARPTAELRAMVGPDGGELVRLWPELARRLPDLPSPTQRGHEAEQYLLFEAVAGLLDAIAATGPVLLVVDDLHEADEQSLALLRSLAHVPRPAAVLVLLVAADDAAGGALPAVLADLLRAPGTERLALGGLGEDDIEAMAESIVGRPLGPGATALAQVLRERTGGNPFFVGELVRHLAETGVLAGGGIAAAAAGPAVEDVPEGVRLVVGQRLARLGGAVEHLLEVVSVIGHGADLTLLTRVVDLGYEDLLGALATAVKARLLDEQPGMPGRYAFRHGIVCDLVYTGIPAARRALLHHRIGAALEGQAGGHPRVPGELADHFGRGEADDSAKAAGYAQQAGDQALGRLFYDEAAYRYRQALAALERESDDGRRADLLLALAEAWTKAGQPTRATTAYLDAAAAARAAGSAERLARAALGAGGPFAFWSLQVEPETAMALLREALAALGDRDDAFRALLLARLAGWLTVSADLGAIERDDPPPFAQAVALAGRIGDPRTLAAVLADRAHALAGVALGRPDGPAEALQRSAELARLALRLGDDGLDYTLDYTASVAQAEALLSAGHLDGVDRLVEAEERAADRRAMPHPRWLSMVLRATRAIMRGEFAAGERLAELALVHGRKMVGEGASLAHGTQLVFLRWLQGRPGDVRAILEDLSQEPLGRGWRKLFPLWHAGLGREAEARRSLDAAAADGFAGQHSGVEVVALVEACALLGDANAAARLYELLLPYKGWHLTAGVAAYLGAGDHHLGMLAATAGRWRDAAGHLLAAMEQHRHLEARPWLARSRQAYAGMLRGRAGADDRRRAEAFDAPTRAIAAPLGMELPGWGREALGPRA
jgi:DNA-binding SARP family transcriptional activator